MLTIRTNTWHAKVYKWFKNSQDRDLVWNSANLCPYMRTVLVWAPLRWLLIAGRIGPVRIPSVIYPVLFLEALPLTFMHFFGWEGLESVYGVYAFLIFVALMAVFGVGIILGIQWLLKKLGQQQSVDSFLEVSGEYIHAAHNKVCPMIKFENDAEKVPVEKYYQ